MHIGLGTDDISPSTGLLRGHVAGSANYNTGSSLFGVVVDHEYDRNGTASIFMFAERLSGFRQATAREQRTKVDWALEVAHLLNTRYAHCEQLTLVCDNLNTHTKGAFYTAFPPEQARALAIQDRRRPHKTEAAAPED